MQSQINENIKAQRHWPVWRIHRWPVNSPHKGPVTRKFFLFDDVIMNSGKTSTTKPYACVHYFTNTLYVLVGAGESSQCELTYIRTHSWFQNVSIYRGQIFFQINQNMNSIAYPPQRYMGCWYGFKWEWCSAFVFIVFSIIPCWIGPSYVANILKHLTFYMINLCGT